MNPHHWGIQTSRSGAISLASLAVLLAFSTNTVAQQPAEAEFQRAFYLQVHENDLAAAADAYESVVDNEHAGEQLRQEAARRLAAVREDLATSDLAELMPPEALVYVEISDVGAHVEELVRMLNLHAEGGLAPGGVKPDARVALGDGLYLPERVTVSPALLEEFKNVRGAAAAVTAITPDGVPQGVAVIHPGDSNLLRGVIESAVQVLEPVEPVGGFPAYTFQHEVWIVQTSRMLVAGSSQAEVAAVVSRLADEGVAGLADAEPFAQLEESRAQATAFAWFSGPRLVEQLRGVLHGEEVMIANAVLDLDHIDFLTLAVGPTEQGLQARARLALKEGHRNLAYALVRTAPLSGRALEYVPTGIAGLALVGLNPPTDGPISTSQAAPYYPTAMDIGRELFANIEELGLFVLPRTEASPGELPLPETAIVVASQDAAKSRALWNQLLAVPTLAMPQLPPPSDVEVGRRPGKEFRYPEAPPILLVQVGDDGIVLGTRGAVEAAVAAGAGEADIASDTGFEPLLAQLTPSSSKAVLVDVGRALETAASAAHPRDAGELRMVASLVGGLRVSLVTDEQPTSLVVRLEAANLPDAQRLIDLATSPHSRPPLAEFEAAPRVAR